jgi:hypothetical protein
MLEDDPKRYGRKTKHVLTHPKRVLFIDEVGANTIQKQDGHIGRRKIVIVKGMCPPEHNAYTDCHFTVLGFTTNSGEPVICAVVVAARQHTALKACGFNPLTDDFVGPETLEEKYEKTNASLVGTAYSP